MRADGNVRAIRGWLLLFMIILTISGLTAVPLVWLTSSFAGLTTGMGVLGEWAATTEAAIAMVNNTHPFLFYGTDLLAFAHVLIALAFIGPYRDPVRNRWVVEWGLVGCALVVLVAFGWAPVRGIPFFWRCVDAAFGILGAVPLWMVLRRIARIEEVPGTHR